MLLDPGLLGTYQLAFLLAEIWPQKPRARGAYPTPPCLAFFLRTGGGVVEGYPAHDPPSVKTKRTLPTSFSLLLCPTTELITMAFKAFVVLMALCLVSLASGFVAPTSVARNGE